MPKGLRAYLLTQSTVTDIVGAGAAARIYYDVLPQNPTLPAIAMHEIVHTSERHLGNNAAIARTTVQVDCFAVSRTISKNLAEQVRLVTEQYSGAMGTETVRQTYMEDWIDEIETPPDAGGDYRFNTSIDLVIWHTET